MMENPIGFGFSIDFIIFGLLIDIFNFVLNLFINFKLAQSGKRSLPNPAIRGRLSSKPKMGTVEKGFFAPLTIKLRNSFAKSCAEKLRIMTDNAIYWTERKSLTISRCVKGNIARTNWSF